MKKILCFVFAISNFCFAQNSPLFEISGPGLTKKSYLFGDLKFTNVQHFVIPPVVNEKIKASKIFAVEDRVDREAQQEMNTAIHLPAGQTLASILTADEYKRVLAFFKNQFKIEKGAFESQYGKLKPVTLAIVIARHSLGHDKIKYYDLELVKIATKAKLKTYSLEPIEREQQAINSYPMLNQTRALLYAIDNYQEVNDELQKLIAEYPYAPLEQMFNYSIHPSENNPLFIEEFYFKRNEEWMPKIEKMMKENASFICVGLSHLEGERGLLQLLKNKGYTLTPISLK